MAYRNKETNKFSSSKTNIESQIDFCATLKVSPPSSVRRLEDFNREQHVFEKQNKRITKSS